MFLLVPLAGMLTLSSAQSAELNQDQLAQAVYETLQAHPELLQKAVSRTQGTNNKKFTKGTSPYQKMNDLARQHHDQVYAHEGYPLLGNRNALHRVVIFLDPLCGHCHGLLQDLATYVKDHDDVAFIIKSVPFLGPLSEQLSEQALHAAAQGTFDTWLEVYLKHIGPLDEKALELFKKMGHIEAASEDVPLRIKAAKDIAKTLTIKSTPTFVIEDRVYEEYRGLEPLSRLIDRRLRKSGLQHKTS